MNADTAYLAAIAASLLEKQASPGSVEASRLRDAASAAYRQGQIMEQAQAQEQTSYAQVCSCTGHREWFGRPDPDCPIHGEKQERTTTTASPSVAVCPWCYGARRN